MDDKAKEIAYDILQHEYIKRKNINVSDENIREILNLFPNEWFTCYSLEKRIKIISLALKNNINIEEVNYYEEKERIAK